jgi:hypothetical protein
MFFYLDHLVQVVEYPKYTVSSLISDIGGAFGCFLGISLIQIISFTEKIFIRIRRGLWKISTLFRRKMVYSSRVGSKKLRAIIRRRSSQFKLRKSYYESEDRVMNITAVRVPRKSVKRSKSNK